MPFLQAAAHAIAHFFYGVGTAFGLSSAAAWNLFAVPLTNALAYSTNEDLIKRVLRS